MHGRFATTVVLSALLTGVLALRPAFAAPEFPQVKIDRIDARNPGAWRVFVTALDEGGRALDLRDSEVSLFLGPQGSSLAMGAGDALARFRDEAPVGGASGTARGLVASGVAHAVVLVVALHAEVPSDVRAALPRTLAASLEGLGPTARVGLLVYGDGLHVLASGVDGAPVLRDLNDFQHCLGAMRGAADPVVDAEPGVACGQLFPGPEAVAAALQTILPPPQGLFPRLLGIPESVDTMTSASERGHSRVDRAQAAGAERFAEGAIEAGLRMLGAGAPPGTLRDLILISDGRDGYLRFADLAWDRVAPACMRDAPVCRRKGAASDPSWEAAFDHEGGSPRCSRAVVDCAVPQVNRVLRDREQVVRDHLVRLVGFARAMDTRILALGMPGLDAVGAARLEALALATGGTWRAAADAAALPKSAAAELAREMAFVMAISPGVDLEPGGAYQVAVRVDGTLRSMPFPFVAGKRSWPFAQTFAGARLAVIARLGHAWGPPAFWVGLVLGCLLVAGMLFLLGKGIAALARRIAGGKRPKPAPPTMPRLKRPEG